MTQHKRSLINRRGYFRDMKPIDYALSVVGLCLGTAAALFPWHVYLNPDSYGPPQMSFSRGGVIPADEVASQQSDAPLRVGPGRFPPQDAASIGLDAVVTGKVDRTGRSASDPNQPFPGNGRSFRVFAIDGTRALIGDADGVYLVTRNNRLPDGTKLKAIERDGAGWHIVTSDGRIIRPL